MQADALLEIESRFNDVTCLVEHFEHGILNGGGSRTSRVGPMFDFEGGTVL